MEKPLNFVERFENWIKENLARKDTRLQFTQDSSLLKTPVHLWRFLKIWNFKNVFFSKKMEIFLWYFCTRTLLMYVCCGGSYKPTTMSGLISYPIYRYVVQCNSSIPSTINWLIWLSGGILYDCSTFKLLKQSVYVWLL